MIGNNTKESRKLRARPFWLRSRRFLGATIGVTGIAYLLGYAIADGLSGMFLALPKALVGTVAIVKLCQWMLLVKGKRAAQTQARARSTNKFNKESLQILSRPPSFFDVCSNEVDHDSEVSVPIIAR